MAALLLAMILVSGHLAVPVVLGCTVSTVPGKARNYIYSTFFLTSGTIEIIANTRSRYASTFEANLSV